MPSEASEVHEQRSHDQPYAFTPAQAAGEIAAGGRRRGRLESPPLIRCPVLEVGVCLNGKRLALQRLANALQSKLGLLAERRAATSPPADASFTSFDTTFWMPALASSPAARAGSPRIPTRK
jgi:hypothetical protein